MQIERCQIKAFGKLKQFTGEFGPGVTVIQGPNESGKSTLVQALCAAFFDSAAGDPGEKEKQGTLVPKNLGEVTLDFKTDGAHYRLHRDFSDGAVKLEKKPGGLTLKDPKGVAEILAGELGLESPELFFATACLRQDESSPTPAASEAVRGKLKEVVTGGPQARAAEAAAQLLKREGEFLQSPDSPDSLPTLEKKQEFLKTEITRLTEELETLRQSRVDFAQIDATLQQVSFSAKEKEAELVTARRLYEAEQALGALAKEFQDLTLRIRELQKSEQVVTTLRATLSGLTPVERQDMTVVEELEARLRYFDSKRAELEAERLQAPEEVPHPSAWLPRVAAYGLGTAGLSALLAVWLWPGFFWIVAGAGSIGGIAAGVFFLQWKIRRDRIMAWELRKSRLAEVERETLAAQNALRTLLMKYRLPSAAALREQYEKTRDVERQIESEMVRYESLLDGKTQKEIENRLQEVIGELNTLKKVKQELGARTVTAEEVAELEATVATLADEEANLTTAAGALRERLAAAGMGSEELTRLQEERLAVDRSLASMKFRQKLYTLTAEGLLQAQETVQSTVVQVLEHEVAWAVEQLSLGRYSKVRLDPQVFRFDLYSAERKDWVASAEPLSHSAAGQVNLAIRLALLKVLSEREKPVVILDEPFAAFDAEREKQALALLEKLAEEYQIFLFTCRPVPDRWPARGSLVRLA